MGKASVPAPAEAHSTLNVADNVRVVLVGDIHGCLDELKSLLETCNFRTGSDVLVCVGDLINKGPQSIETLRYLRDIRAYAVRGNHDHKVLKVYHAWKRSHEQPEDRYTYVCNYTDSDMEWLAAHPFTLTIPRINCRVVHAGLVPGVDLDKQLPDHMMEMREVVANDKGGLNAIEKNEKANGSVPWASVWTGPEWMVFGHDAKRQLQQHPFALGLDTGCVYGNHLTAAVVKVPSEDIQPPALPTYTLFSVPATQIHQKPTAAAED